MKRKHCLHCDQEIKVRNCFVEGGIPNEELKEPCNTCEHNEKDEDEMPCLCCVFTD